MAVLALCYGAHKAKLSQLLPASLHYGENQEARPGIDTRQLLSSTTREWRSRGTA